MPSPRGSPALRPSSPLSSRFDSSPRYDTLLPPPQRSIHPRNPSNGQQQRQQHSNALKLPSLPRFHPANFPSSHSSSASTPASGPTSPQGMYQPSINQRLHSDAQRQLYFHHRDTLASYAGLGPSLGSRDKPATPNLGPTGSPGPVTPLELEEDEGYLMAGAARQAVTSAPPPHELIERLTQAQTRQGDSSSRAASSSKRRS